MKNRELDRDFVYPPREEEEDVAEQIIKQEAENAWKEAFFPQYEDYEVHE